MIVSSRVFFRKGAREAAAAALTHAVLAGRDDAVLQIRGAFRGFDILSKGGANTGG